MNRKWLALMTAGCLTLSSCSLLPEEETFRTAPLIGEYETEEFTLSVCARGDIELGRTISCVYVPVRTESMGFEVSGVGYDQFYVEVGDSVQAGDLLVQLKLDGLEENIESIQRQIERINLQMEHVAQNRELALRREAVQNRTKDASSQQEALRKLNIQYDEQQQSLKDELELAQLRLNYYEEKLAQRQLRAPLSGTVTYIRQVKSGDLSALHENVITVADSAMSLFRTETDCWNYFHPGDTVTITAGKTDYEATVKSEEELGLPVTEHVEGQKAYVYFALNEPTFELEDNDRGNFRLVLDARYDVLCVPSGAVSSINGETVVYYLNDEGMKAYKKVTVGLDNNTMIEILDGLEENETVIVED